MIHQYEKYKDSSFDFIGKVPYNWELVPLKHISSISKGKKPIEDFQDFQNGMLPYLSMEFLRDQNSGPVYVKKDDPSVIFVEENDLLVLWDGSNAGEIVKEKKGSLSSTMGKIHLINCSLNLNFLTYYLKASEVHLKNNTVGMGIPHINGGLLRNLPILKPTIGEQTQIVRFLDHQTTIIDEIIQRKEKQIELLKEKRQSVINEVVTKGLNPNAKMKNNGIKWMGEIPEEWKIVRLRFLGKCQNGVSQSGDYFGTGDPFVSYSDVYKNDALPSNVNGLAESSESDKENYSVVEGDVFFTRTSETIEEIGLSSVCLSTIENAVFAGFLIRFRPYQNVLYKGYSRYFFRSLVPRVHFVKEMNLVTRASLSQELLKSLPVCLPNLIEQKEIASFLDRKVLNINEVVQHNEKAIKKLKEYRQSLISEAVTGKIDVRDWQPGIDYQN